MSVKMQESANERACEKICESRWISLSCSEALFADDSCRSAIINTVYTIHPDGQALKIKITGLLTMLLLLVYHPDERCNCSDAHICIDNWQMADNI